MSIEHLMAQAVVSDLTRAEQWYGALFGRALGARPMHGLVEWHLNPVFGVQVFRDPARAGQSAMVLGETDLDGLAARLTAAGVQHDGPQTVTASRVLILRDPEGNQIIATGQ